MTIFYLGGRRDGELQIQLDRNEEDEDSRPPGRPNNQGRVEEEELLVCPYNSSHRIRPERFAHHLNKCMKSNPKRHEFVVCVGNSLHHVHWTQIEAHQENCEDYQRHMEWMERNALDAATLRNPGNQLQINREVTTEENWDIVDTSIIQTMKILPKLTK